MHNSDISFDEIRNIGLLDRGMRIAIGAVAILAVLVSQNTGMLGWVALVPLLAVYPIMTGLLAYDPFYAWIGINTSSSSVFSDKNFRKFVTTVTAEDTPSSDTSHNEKMHDSKRPRNAA